jgi:large subunit ribosomal protein L10
MPKTRAQKEQTVKKVTDAFDASKSAVFFLDKGLPVNDTVELRAKMREVDGQIVGLKKTLLKKALTDKKLGELDMSSWEGVILAAFAADEVSAAKVIAEFAKDREEQMELKSGMLEGALISDAEVKNLASLPSKEQLLGKFVGTINAPVSGFANVLAGTMRGFVTALHQLSEQKQEAGA